MNRCIRVLLVGYYGYGNFGDDLLLNVILRHLTDLDDVEVAVAWPQVNDDYVKSWYPTVELRDAWQEPKRFYSQFDRVLFGGGGMIFDYRPAMSLSQRLRKRAGQVIRFGLPRLAGTRFAGVGLGIGPFDNRKNQVVSLQHLKYQDFVYLRDEPSRSYAAAVIGERAILGADLSFAEYSRVRDLVRAPAQGKIVIVIRHFKYGSHCDAYVTSLLQAAVALGTAGKSITWVSFQKEYDEPVLERIRSVGEEIWVWNPRTMTTHETFHLFADAECVVSARLHGLYVAAMLHVPCVGINLHPKLETASQSLGASSAVVSANPKPDEIIEAVQQASCIATRYDDFDIAAKEQRVQEMLTHVQEWMGR